jgi:hypothetical protein
MTHPLVVDHPADFQIVEPREIDKFERLANMYGKELTILMKQASEALEEFALVRSYSAWLKYKNVNDRIGEAMIMRNAMRTHSDTFRDKFPDTGAVLNQP